MSCKHDWHSIEGTERLQCARCKAEAGPQTYDQRVQNMLHDVATIGSAWSKGGERINPLDVYAVPTWYLQGYKLHDSQPNSILFYGKVNDQQTEVLRISKDGIFANPDVPVDEAAKKVLEALGNNLTAMIERARREEREACADECVKQAIKGGFAADCAEAIRARGQA